MTKKEVELMAMLIDIHKKLDSIHNETEVSDEFMIRYVSEKLSFELKDKDREQILKWRQKENTQRND